MPIEIYIAVLVACGCMVVLTLSVLIVAMYVHATLARMEQSAAKMQSDVSALAQESRGIITEMRRASSAAASSMEDVKHMTHTARGWTDRADHLIVAVGAIVEPPVFLVSKKIQMAGGFVSGVLQALLNSKSE
ncbi:MAG: DUF948 domain-containing protein [Phycisphaeraceae bacterium]